MTEIRALTLTQPWATLIQIGAKTVETRGWQTQHRGPVMIHAGSSYPCKGGQSLAVGDFTVTRHHREGLRLHGLYPEGSGIEPYPLPQGYILALANLVGIEITTRARRRLGPAELAYGDYSPGRFAWFLDDVRPLPEAVPCAGSLGLWRPDADLIRAVAEQFADLSEVPQ